MTTISDFLFNNVGRIGYDLTDNSQRNISNTMHANYMLENHFSKNTGNSHVKFATLQPNMNFKGNGGVGIPSSHIDNDSNLLIGKSQERPFEKLQLFQRPFATIPYLGKGRTNSIIESYLQQGESVGDKKSISTIIENSFNGYKDYPLDDDLKKRIEDPSNYVEENALNGWVRGGIASRETFNDNK